MGIDCLEQADHLLSAIDNSTHPLKYSQDLRVMTARAFQRYGDEREKEASKDKRVATDGEVDIDGRVVEWEYRAGFLKFGGTYSIFLPGDPSVGAIEAALRGWHFGHMQGRNDGRSVLQNELRNLLGCAKS